MHGVPRHWQDFVPWCAQLLSELCTLWCAPLPPPTCRMTQWPSAAATSMACSATISWPCPRDTLWIFPLSMVKPNLVPGRGMCCQ